jgi:adenosylhomocysteine nucleosidase
MIERKRWLILTAVVAEAKSIARALGVGYRVGAFPKIDQRVDGVAGVQVIGVGARALPEQNLPWERVAGIVLAGFAGGLDPALKVGDVVVEGITAEAAESLSLRNAALHTVSELTCTAEQKATLRRATGAAAVEMEGAVVREFARVVGVRFVQVRAISDVTDEGVDARLLRGIDCFGRVKVRAMTGMILRHPAVLRGLLQLGANARVAGRQLADAVVRLVESNSAT